MGFETDALKATDLANISMAMQAAGAVSSSAAAYSKSSAEKYGYEFQSKVARNNAQIAGWQADDASRRGQREEDNHRLKVAALKGTQTANLAARGIDLGEGSALNILTDTDFMGERDALLIRDNTNKEVWGFKQTARNYEDNANLLQSRADQENPFMAATGTLLTGAGAVARSWYAMRTKTAL